MEREKNALNETYLGVEWFLGCFFFVQIFVHIVLAHGRNAKSVCAHYTPIASCDDEHKRRENTIRLMQWKKTKSIFISEELLKNRNQRKLATTL